ncbi:MAG: protein adenylyltransferase SelO family protein, partial [Pseudomonadota bacterium]
MPDAHAALPRLSPGLADLGEPLVRPWQGAADFSTSFAEHSLTRVDLAAIDCPEDVVAAESLQGYLATGRWPEQSWPVSLDYAGHQFGRFNAALGDGRVVQLGEFSTGDTTLEVGLKGIGRTALASRGDGWAALGECETEFDTYRALDALGVPTARGVMVIRGARAVHRRGRLEPVGLLCRVAPTFVRFGCFELHYRLGRYDALQTLCDH